METRSLWNALKAKQPCTKGRSLLFFFFPKLTEANRFRNTHNEPQHLFAMNKIKQTNNKNRPKYLTKNRVKGTCSCVTVYAEKMNITVEEKDYISTIWSEIR